MNSLGNRRLTDVQLSGGMGHVHGFADGDEYLQMTKCHRITCFYIGIYLWFILYIGIFHMERGAVYLFHRDFA